MNGSTSTRNTSITGACSSTWGSWCARSPSSSREAGSRCGAASRGIACCPRPGKTPLATGLYWMTGLLDPAWLCRPIRHSFAALMRKFLRSLNGWPSLATALAVLSLGGISHEHKRFLRSPEGKATFSVKPSRLIDELRIDLVGDGDALRYRAYDNATLGWRHQSYFGRAGG